MLATPMAPLRDLLKAGSIGLFLLGILGGGLLWGLPAGEPGPPRLVEIAPGTPLRQVAWQLHREGLLRHPWLWIGVARITGADRAIRAGEYRLDPSDSPWSLLQQLREGRVWLREVVIPEGATLVDIARILAQQHLVQVERFLQAARDPTLLQELGIPGPSAEGYLFPDHYRFARGQSEASLIRAMVRRLEEVYTPAMEARARELGLTRHQVLTLASLIEKEAFVDEERPLIAAVFYNRLRRGMPLQSDPTVIYALGERFDGNLRRSDLRFPSPYNTYLHPGLPPGPIASPGLASIRAALHPAPVDYLYFVSRNDGTHHFSHTLSEHRQAVARYQRGKT